MVAAVLVAVPLVVVKTAAAVVARAAVARAAVARAAEARAAVARAAEARAAAARVTSLLSWVGLVLRRAYVLWKRAGPDLAVARGRILQPWGGLTRAAGAAAGFQAARAALRGAGERR